MLRLLFGSKAHGSREGNHLGEANHQNYLPCVVCNLDASLVCPVCYTRYCSARCQLVDWPQHQVNCSPPP